MLKTDGLNFDEAFQAVQEYEHGFSDFSRDTGKYIFSTKPELQKGVSGSPAAIMQLWESQYSQKKAQLNEAIKRGAIKAYGFKVSPMSKEMPEEIEYRSFVSAKIDPVKNTAATESSRWEGVYFSIPAKAAKVKAKRGQYASEPEILQMYEEDIFPALDQYETLAAVRRKIQERAKNRYGALYHHEFHPNGHKGFSKDTIENALRERFKKDKS